MTEQPVDRERGPRARPVRMCLAAILAIAAVLAASPRADAQSQFIRADSNDDGKTDVADVVCTLLFLFGGNGACQRAACLDSKDANDDGRVDMTDALFLLDILFIVSLRQVPPPHPDCGPDPTMDQLGCELSNACDVFDGITFEIGPETRLYSIWSEGYDTARDQHEVLSIIRLREGSHRVFADRDTEDLKLIESLAFGPDLVPATALGTGTFFHDGGNFYPHEYRQSFETSLGEWTFRMAYRGSAGPVDLDCALLDGESFETSVLLFAELRTGDRTRTVHYSCFSPEVWMPARGATPRRLTLDDGTILTVEMEEAYLFRGVAGETANRRMSAAAVEMGGETIEVAAFDRLVYAALHHNSQQEFRVLFDAPRGAVHGIELIDCPPGVGPPFFCYLPTPGESKAYLLNEALERTTELTVVEAEIGAAAE